MYHGLNIPWSKQGTGRTKTLLAKDTEIEHKFFAALGQRIQTLRKRRGYSQEDMISFGYTVRYWQRIEAGKPITLRTLLRICRHPGHDHRSRGTRIRSGGREKTGQTPLV